MSYTAVTPWFVSAQRTDSDHWLGAAARIVKDDSSNNYPMLPINIACNTVGHRHWLKGSVYDMWFGPHVDMGTTYSEPAKLKHFIQFDRLIFPWDGLVVPGGSKINLS